MTHDLAQTIALLTRTPAALDSLLRGLSDFWTERNEGPVNNKAVGDESWTVHQVIAHLVHTERYNWMPRARWLLEYGESKSFEPVRHVQYDQGIENLLEGFAEARSDSLRQLGEMRLTAADLTRCGLHPKFGVVNLSQLLATWAVHDLTHLHQISRIMAYQYREAVGPWTEFLGVLHCDGHGSF